MAIGFRAGNVRVGAVEMIEKQNYAEKQNHADRTGAGQLPANVTDCRRAGQESGWLKSSAACLP